MGEIGPRGGVGAVGFRRDFGPEYAEQAATGCGNLNGVVTYDLVIQIVCGELALFPTGRLTDGIFEEVLSRSVTGLVFETELVHLSEVMLLFPSEYLSLSILHCVITVQRQSLLYVRVITTAEQVLGGLSV
ncbi:hypothetical protein WUBG_03128 [Wuchereria bancrofti]|uniref:Uncharacterized protein n=1 Tax=Wuchereria bancrofti TaxID=6293 RepID=J9EUW1_WUCBA|nr:hypothetical protein WUBG_03128 [Wuchereria bancrofti]VDM07960.1 unnamed protein product [Wuchereria bancrofti]